MNVLKCSIIIRSFNEQKHIGRLLEGIEQQTLFSSVEVIVVDSGSTDATVKIAQRHNAKIVHIKPEEFSFGRALNIGCKEAKGEYLLFASAHVYPLYTNWIERMLKPFENDKVALVYGKQVGNEVTQYSEHQIFKKWFPEESNYNQSTPFCNNANAAIRKQLWVEQPFDELLTGLEDLDWATKIQRKGNLVAYEAHAPIVHVHEEPISKIKNRYMREAVALKLIMPKQHVSFWDFIRLVFSNIITDSFHACYEGRFIESFKQIILFRTMQFWGTYIGFRQSGRINEELKRRFYYPNELKRGNVEGIEPGELINYYAIKI